MGNDLKTLKGESCNPSSIGTGRGLGLLGANAGRANIHDSVEVSELGDPFDKLVRIEQVMVTGVAEALMPQKAFSILAKREHGGGAGKIRMRRWQGRDRRSGQQSLNRTRRDRRRGTTRVGRNREWVGDRGGQEKGMGVSLSVE